MTQRTVNKESLFYINCKGIVFKRKLTSTNGVSIVKWRDLVLEKNPMKSSAVDSGDIQKISRHFTTIKIF